MKTILIPYVKGYDGVEIQMPDELMHIFTSRMAKTKPVKMSNGGKVEAVIIDEFIN